MESSSGDGSRQKCSDDSSYLQNTWHLYSVGSSDPGYKLPLYLSEFALHDFYMKKSRSVAPNSRYEKVNVVETLFRINSVNTTTYLITFEASLQADDTIQTFVTKISMPLPDPHHPTTKMNFPFVKIKGEEFDYEEEDEDDISDSGSPKLFYDDSDSECDDDDEQHSKQSLPDCNKKDFQTHLDGFHNGEQSKENSPNNVSEENLKESHEEHFEDKSSEFQKKDSQKTLQGIDDKHSKENFPEFHKKDSKGNLSEFDEEVAKKGVDYRPSPTPFRVPMKYKVGPKLREELESFNNDLARSDGFEVGYYPRMERAGIHGTRMFKFYDIENKTLGSTDMNNLVCLAQLAICVYNMKEDTYFDNVKVLKAMTSGCQGVTYNITFEASLRDTNAVIFQTRLFTALPLPYAKIEILFVRIRASC